MPPCLHSHHFHHPTTRNLALSLSLPRGNPNHIFSTFTIHTEALPATFMLSAIKAFLHHSYNAVHVSCCRETPIHVAHSNQSKITAFPSFTQCAATMSGDPANSLSVFLRHRVPARDHANNQESNRSTAISAVVTLRTLLYCYKRLARFPPVSPPPFQHQSPHHSHTLTPSTVIKTLYPAIVLASPSQPL